ncbi:hypothetical protein J437_LFUL005806 [Ladona fulva]|uniref:Uncharacterized protein n=1 Tax=Ladona fulva TaxID=123851 RepID=A0A8K0NVJ2_LADFU|nr:hypothetical protein J437_LFUL005806 [Ladona fulva]
MEAILRKEYDFKINTRKTKVVAYYIQNNMNGQLNRERTEEVQEYTSLGSNKITIDEWDADCQEIYLNKQYTLSIALFRCLGWTVWGVEESRTLESFEM